jgi:UDP-N-acetylglucosamine--N-acetylmuramyl-(pentapeptide) pyrophosphoryl-undecaprenol N-acetylglucosamine transferase
VISGRLEAQWVGNPVRADLFQVTFPQYRGTGYHVPKRVLVLGGSQGALALNECLPEALQLMSDGVRPSVRHQAGEQHWEATRAAYRAAGLESTVVPFIEDMAEALSWADLVIARAGALTLAELTAVGVGSILVPFPFAIDDHQTRNAQALVKAGAAVLLPQSEFTPNALQQVLERCLQPETLQDMAMAAKQLGRPQATQAVVEVLEQQLEVANAA